MTAASRGRTLGLVATGSMLEFYEFQTSAIFVSTIGTVFFSPSQPGWIRELQAVALISVSFLFRPVSALVVGRIGDREGRKRSFLLTLLMMAVPTICIGLLPGYGVLGLGAPVLLLILRIVQAMASAGELSGAAVFSNEIARPDRRGLASGSLYGAIHLGYLLAAAVAGVVTGLLAPAQVISFGWRLPFLLGGALGFIALLARRKLQESPAYLAAKDDARRPAPLTVLVREYRLEVVAVALLAGYVGSIIAVLYVFSPPFLQSAYHVPTARTAWLIMVAYVLLAGSAVLWGRISDAIGATVALRIGAALSILVVAAAGIIGVDPSSVRSLLGWYALVSLAVGNVGCAFQVGTSLFPTSIRLTGFGVSYNLGLAIFVGSVPLLIGFASHRFGAVAIVIFVTIAGLLGIISTLIADSVQRTKPVDLLAYS